jgi:hypothetical protein
MAGPHEEIERSEQAEHAAHRSKRIALLISVLALFLAFSEMLGKRAATEAVSLNIKASDAWNFFQAKTIRQTSLRIAADAMGLQVDTAGSDAAKAALAKQIETWRQTARRYESDPAEKDGRKELRAQAEKFEHQRDTDLARYHHYEVSSAAFQIGIVLASAAVITGIATLTWAAAGLGVLGLVFMAIGLYAPHAVHLM